MTQKSFTQKLLDFQTEVGAISKDSTNPFYNSQYFDINKLLEVVKPLMNKNRLFLSQPLTHVEGKPAIKTMIVDVDGEGKIESTTIIPEISDPQKAGAAITYFRRYSLQSILGLQAEDDDANSCIKKTKTPKTATTTVTNSNRPRF